MTATPPSSPVPAGSAPDAPLALLGLRTVIYPAPDLAATRQWWSDLLGIAPYFDEAFYVGFTVAGYELALWPAADPADGALTYWGVDDAAAAVDRVVAAGGTVHTPPTEVGGGIVTAMTRTPSGTLLGLIVNPHFQVP